MHTRRFFVKSGDITNDQVLIRGQDAVHIHESLRLRAGDTISVLDGEGTQYDVVLERISSRSVRGNVLARRVCDPDVNLQVALVHALPKGSEKVKFILRRGTELGLSEIGFFSSARSVPRIRDFERRAEKLDRWKRIVTDAAKQCGRVTLPKVSLFAGLSEALDYCDGFDMTLAAWEGEGRTGLRDAVKNAGNVDRVAVVVGPEGGFERAEVQFAEKRGATAFSMGKRILRSEFAGIAAATMILYEFGELG